MLFVGGKIPVSVKRRGREFLSNSELRLLCSLSKGANRLSQTFGTEAILIRASNQPDVR